MDPKARLATALVLFLAVWPALHHAFMVRTGGDPWKLFGWSMYTMWPPQHALSLYTDCGEVVRVTSASREVAEASVRYLEWYRTFGSLASAAGVAAAFESPSPACEALVIEVTTIAMDPTSARFQVARVDREVYSLGAPPP